MVKIKICPFCGTEPTFNDSGYMECEKDGCNAIGPNATYHLGGVFEQDVQEIAINLWNERFEGNISQNWLPISEAPKSGQVLCGRYLNGEWTEQLVQHWSVNTLISTGWTHFHPHTKPPKKGE